MIFTGTGNANKILGIPVQTGTPSDTFTLLYDAASNRWIFGPSGTPPAGGVGGGANLTTVGSIPFVTSSGVLGQSANLFWDNANARLGVGTNAPQRPAHIRNAGGLRIDTASSGFDLTNTNTGEWQITAVNSISRFGILGSLWTHSATGNVAIGTTTDDGTNRLQVAGSVAVGGLSGANSSVAITRTGSGLSSLQLGAFNNKPTVIFNGTSGLAFETFSASLMNLSTGGTLALYNETPTIGSTSLVVRAGAGQGSNNLTTWQNSGGATIAQVGSGGGLLAGEFETNTAGFNVGGALMRGANNFRLSFSSTSSYGGTLDLSLSRASANTLQVGDGGSNSNGIILSRRVQSAGETVASLPAAAAGNAGTISYVTDSNSTTIGATVAGGGANKVLVWSNGTAWRIFAN